MAPPSHRRVPFGRWGRPSVLVRSVMDAEPRSRTLVRTPCRECGGLDIHAFRYAALHGESLSTVYAPRPCRQHPIGRGWTPGVVPPL
jgi:hypothetical protein